MIVYTDGQDVGSYASDEWMACRECGNCYQWGQRHPDYPQVCHACLRGQSRLAEDGPFVKVGFVSSLKRAAKNGSVELERAKRERAARRGGWRPVSGFTLDRSVPTPAASVYDGPSSQWLKV